MYDESWLGNKDEDLFYEIDEFSQTNKIHVGFTKTNNFNSTGKGIIGQLFITLNNSARLAKNFNDIYEFRVNTIGTQNGSEYTLIEDQILQIDVSTDNCQPNWTITEDTPFKNSYNSSAIIETNGFVLIGADQQVTYQANNRVKLNSGFSARAGADFKIKNENCQ